MKTSKSLVLGVVACAAISFSGSNLLAAMVLTNAGTSAGFTLTTVATNFETTGANGGLGPLGITVAPNGSLLVGTWPNGKLYSLPDTDNQVMSNLNIINGSGLGGGNAHSLATVNGNVYLVEKFANGGSLVRIDPTTGAIVQTLFTNLDPAGPLGLVVNPTNGHLLMGTSSQGIYDIDPVAVTKTKITTTSADGVSVSADGTIVYGATNGGVLGFRISDGTKVFDTAGLIPGADGTAVGTGSLAGNLFVNTNGGQIVEVDLTSKVSTVLANGGSRGDFVYVDPNNGSLLLSQSNSVLRLSPPNGGGFGGGGSGGEVPEPSSVFMAATAGIGGLAYTAQKRRKGC